MHDRSITILSGFIYLLIQFITKNIREKSKYWIGIVSIISLAKKNTRVLRNLWNWIKALWKKVSAMQVRAWLKLDGFPKRKKITLFWLQFYGRCCVKNVPKINKVQLPKRECKVITKKKKKKKRKTNNKNYLKTILLSLQMLDYIVRRKMFYFPKTVQNTNLLLNIQLISYFIHLLVFRNTL